MNGCFLSASCTATFELVFCLNTVKRFFFRFHFKGIGKSTVYSKNEAKDFQKSPPFERLACFYVKIAGRFEGFQYLKFEINFLKNENIFSKN